jgi:flagellar biosynthesis component FlhA
MKTFLQFVGRFILDVIAAETVSFAAALIVLALCVVAGLPAGVCIGIAGAVKFVAWVAVFILD